MSLNIRKCRFARKGAFLRSTYYPLRISGYDPRPISLFGIAISPTFASSGCRISSTTDNSAPCDEIKAIAYFSRAWFRNPR